MWMRQVLSDIGEKRISDSILGVKLVNKINEYLPPRVNIIPEEVSGNDCLLYIGTLPPSIRVLVDAIEIHVKGPIPHVVLSGDMCDEELVDSVPIVSEVDFEPTIDKEPQKRFFSNVAMVMTLIALISVFIYIVVTMVGIDPFIGRLVLTHFQNMVLSRQ